MKGRSHKDMDVDSAEQSYAEALKYKVLELEGWHALRSAPLSPDPFAALGMLETGCRSAGAASASTASWCCMVILVVASHLPVVR